MFQLAGDRHTGRSEVDVAALRVELGGDAATDRHPLQPFEEVDVEEGAAELAISHRAQSCGLLLGDDLADRLVFDQAERGEVDLVLEEPIACVLEPLRPQPAPDMIGAKRGIQCCHFECLRSMQ